MEYLIVIALYAVAGVVISLIYAILDSDPSSDDLGLAFLFWPFLIIIAVTETIGKIMLRIHKMARKLKT
jgi:hypothetical protein